ncbi:UBX domain-containing protein 6 [Cichlidogyrus casuarinus]|uniref:UBX domain-containing protein 6 n=1 Tax=Cichlidogyrus casuarinus TaxID=1844966 RepID=A0ABD2PYF7_9PLAT
MQEERWQDEKELEEALQLKERFTKEIKLDAPQALSQVLFWCPSLFGSELIGPYKVVESAIDEFLSKSAYENPSEVAALAIVRGLERSKLPEGVDPTNPSAPLLSEVRVKRRQNLVKILSNLLASPDNPKFRKLRISNKIVSDLLSIEGAELYFQTCGFVHKLLPASEDPNLQEDVLFVPDDVPFDVKKLENMLELMETATPIVSELYRDTKIFTVSYDFILLLKILNFLKLLKVEVFSCDLVKS